MHKTNFLKKKSKNFFLFSFFFFLFVIAGVFAVNLNNKRYDPDKVIENLYDAIEFAEKNGDYHCCIHPSCTMCYMGNWVFEKGTCFCDEAIKNGEFDKVCPECKKGLEEGLCSSIEESCEEDG